MFDMVEEAVEVILLDIYLVGVYIIFCRYTHMGYMIFLEGKFMHLERVSFEKSVSFEKVCHLRKGII